VVVMSLGDSITAAFAAKEKFILDGLREFRGISWCIGGDKKLQGRDVFSVPNFLKHVSGKLPQGASVGVDVPVDAIKKDGKMPYHGIPWVDHLNGAQSEAKAQDCPDQVDWLVQQMKKSKKINMQEDWKMMSILIGANNGCGACRKRDDDSAEAYYEALNTTLTRAYTQIPRLFVNLVEMFNTSGVYTQQLTSKYCMFIQSHLTECGCMEGTDEDRRLMDEHIVSYNVQLRRLADEWTARNLTGFKVVSQPGLSNMPVPSREYLSGVDCFHPNQYAHGGFAIGLWNNLQKPTGSKSTSLDPATVVIDCPTEDMYLQ